MQTLLLKEYFEGKIQIDMPSEQQFKIKEIADFYDMTPRTLRYYENLKLLKPDRVNLGTAYRYYGKEAIERLEAISQLKGMGFTLDEIKNCLRGRFPTLNKIEDCKDEIAKLNFKMRELEFLGTRRGKYEADIVNIPSRVTLAREFKMESHADLIEKFHGFICDMILQKVRLMPLKRYFLELVSGRFADGNPLVRIHANVAVDKDTPAGVGLFEGRKFLRTCHRGTWPEISNAFKFLLEYSEKNEIKLGKPAVISYVNGTFITDDKNNLVTVCLPVL